MVIYEREIKRLVIPVGYSDQIGGGIPGSCEDAIKEAYKEGKQEQAQEDLSKLESIKISENGVYEPEYGYNHVEVNVSNRKKVVFKVEYDELIFAHNENLTMSVNGVPVEDGGNAQWSGGSPSFIEMSGYTEESVANTIEIEFDASTEAPMFPYPQEWDAVYIDRSQVDDFTQECEKTQIGEETYHYHYTFTFDSVPLFDVETYDEGYADGYSNGKTDGYTSGYTDGYSSGRTDGYSSGRTDGYSSGWTDGYSSGRTDGYTSGSTDGYSSGWTDGYSSGYTDGYETAESIMDISIRLKTTEIIGSLRPIHHRLLNNKPFVCRSDTDEIRTIMFYGRTIESAVTSLSFIMEVYTDIESAISINSKVYNATNISIEQIGEGEEFAGWYKYTITFDNALVNVYRNDEIDVELNFTTRGTEDIEGHTYVTFGLYNGRDLTIDGDSYDSTFASILPPSIFEIPYVFQTKIKVEDAVLENTASMSSVTFTVDCNGNDSYIIPTIQTLSIHGHPVSNMSCSYVETTPSLPTFYTAATYTITFDELSIL